jgi:hypothetical protein
MSVVWIKHGATLSSNLQPEALIKILQEVTKANGVPLFGVYDAMKKNPPKAGIERIYCRWFCTT